MLGCRPGLGTEAQQLAVGAFASGMAGASTLLGTPGGATPAPDLVIVSLAALQTAAQVVAAFPDRAAAFADLLRRAHPDRAAAAGRPRGGAARRGRPAVKVRVGHLRCRYRVAGSPAGASAAAARLDRLARTRMSGALADAMDRALGDDPTVYIVRRVESRVVLVGSDEAELARVWGQGMARAILRLLARTSGDGADVVRFRDEADFAGSFVADLLRGQAYGRWYYGTFSALRALSTRDAVRSVLVKRRDDVPAILQVVRRLGVMEQLLAAADDALLEFLWRGHVGLTPAGAEAPVPAGAEAPVPAGAEDPVPARGRG